VQGTVSKVLARHEVKLHKVRYYYLERRDEAFEAKMAYVLCVYREVAIISYDKKPGIQAIGTTTPDRPRQPGTHPTFARDHEYKRHCTLSQAGRHRPADRTDTCQHRGSHRSREFVGFLKKPDAAYPEDFAIKVVLDSLSAHISKETRA
jgi:hypothetical protein